MTKHYKYLLFSLLFLFLFSCTSKEKQIESLKSEVIDIHDEVMPRMNEVMQLKKELVERGNSIDSSQIETLAEIQSHILYLEEADEEMMNWMRNYDPEMKDMTEEEKIAYLKKEKVSIKLVKQIMMSAITESKLYLEQEIPQ